MSSAEAVEVVEDKDEMASTMTKATRSVKKLEVPRPLKSSTSQSNRNSVIDTKINSLENVIELTEAVACQLSAGDYDRAIQTNIPTMCSNLKLFGAQAELMYKDFLDRYFVVFRNASLDDKLDKHSRTHLLELIELRAKQWHTNDYMSLYYRHQVTNVEPLLVPTDDVGGGAVMADGTGVPTTPIEGPALLAPGELIKPSGKFPKPTKIPGKNYSKDEVVIRNADSGKVMGIKGRRVHMIEQLSDTIISFQRVSPGAKERLVQITGPNEENVNHAKHLIGDVIRRNASPVRVENAAEPAANSPDLEDEQPIKERSPHSARSLHHSLSTNDAAIGVYKHTVTYGALSLKITGDNLEFVKTAKLVLDEHFNSCVGGAGAGGEGEGSGDFFTLLQHPELAPLNGQDDEVFAPSHHHLAHAHAHAHALADTGYGAGEATVDMSLSGRRARFSRASSTDKNSQGGSGGARRTYSVEMLVQLGRSPLSRAAPLALSTFPPELARKVARDWDGDSFLKRVRVSGLVAQDAPDSPEPE